MPPSGGAWVLFFGERRNVVFEERADARDVPKPSSFDVAGAAHVGAFDEPELLELVEVGPRNPKQSFDIRVARVLR